LCLQALCQDEPTTTSPTTKTTTTAATTTPTTEKTTPEPVITCIVCSANSTAGENMNCFDGEGEEKEFGKDGYCSYKYGMVELNGEKTYTIERRGHDKRGDVSEYPHKSTKDIWSSICTDSTCNDRNAKSWFGVSELVNAARAFFGDDEKTTTAASTTTTTTTTAPPNFSCYQCISESTDGNYTDIESCGSVDDSVNEFVCGSEDIGSCITQFEKETDLEESINNLKVSRDCNAKDNSQDTSETSTTNIEYFCIESLCNNDPLEGSFSILSINLLILALTLFQ